MLKGLDTSAIQYIQVLTPVAVSAAGTTTAVDLSKFTHATLILMGGSTGAAAITASVLRAGASNGSFLVAKDAASVNFTVANKTHVRSFGLNSSAVWHKVSYAAVAGSPIVGILFAVGGTRVAPIDQDSNTTSYSVVGSA